jgi:hypothetical protein
MIYFIKDNKGLKNDKKNNIRFMLLNHQPYGT